jgi:hypothetical protein
MPIARFRIRRQPGRPPVWRAFLIHQLQMFMHAEVLDASLGQALAEDLEALSATGSFHTSFTIRKAVGTEPV